MAAPSPAKKFGAPEPGVDVDAGKFAKLAQRVEEALTTKALHHEPKQIDPNLILVSPNNRLGPPPNVQHVHQGILKSIFTNSFDRTRPAIGICVKYESAEGIRKVLEHNRKFTDGNKLLPPILNDGSSGPVYASLACTHLNIALRCIKNGTQSPVCDLKSMMESNQTLKDAAGHGHKWWVLPEDLSDDAQHDISLWRNQDQNENQATHELEILQTIQHAAEACRNSGAKTVNQGDLIAAAQKRNPAKVGPESWMTLSKYYIGFLDEGLTDLVEDLSYFHSACVDPRELCVSLKYFKLVASEPAFKACPQLRHYLVTSQYTKEKALPSTTGPATAQFLESLALTTLAKKPEMVLSLEKTIRETKSKYLPILEKSLGSKQARLEMTVLIDLFIRCTFAKPWPENMAPKLTMKTGKWSVDTVGALKTHWAKCVDLKHPGFHFAADAGLAEAPSDDPLSAVPVDLAKLKDLKRNPSDGPDLREAPRFQMDDAVTVVRRMSWPVPTKANPSFRKDLPEGLSGVIAGFTDTEGRKVLLKVDLTVDGKKHSVTQACSPQNLQLTSEFMQKDKAAEPEPAAPATTGADEIKKSLKWLVGSSDPKDVKVEEKWALMQADTDALNKAMWTRGRISVALQSMSEVLPKYGDQDFLVAYRRNEKGLWKAEVYANRDFGPYEILLAPYSSQVKDTNLTAAAHANISLPKTGRGAHPEGQSLALDGRCRSMLARKGTLSDEEHTGSLFWAISRVPDKKQANLTLDSLSWEQEIKVKLPGPPNKKRKVEPVSWDSSELPSIPTLVNLQKIKKHTMLKVYLSEKKQS